MITVQPIRYTSHQADWHRFAQTLGLVPAFPPNTKWSEFDGDGILAIHHAAPGETPDAATELHLLTDDLDAVETRLAAAGFSASSTVLDDIGRMLTVTASSRATVTISGNARAARSGPLAVQPIWYQPDLSEPRRILEAIGLTARIASDSGGWLEFGADGGGQAALHHGEGVRCELSMAYSGDLDTLAQRLTDAGHRATVTDEAYNRALRVATPDGEELWINGDYEDLYGYSRLSPTS